MFRKRRKKETLHTVGSNSSASESIGGAESLEPSERETDASDSSEDRSLRGATCAGLFGLRDGAIGFDGGLLRSDERSGFDGIERSETGGSSNVVGGVSGLRKPSSSEAAGLTPVSLRGRPRCRTERKLPR